MKAASIRALAAHKTPDVVFSVADEAIFEMFPCYEFALRNSLQGLLRELNPGPLGPKPRIMPLDQAAMQKWQVLYDYLKNGKKIVGM